MFEIVVALCLASGPCEERRVPVAAADCAAAREAAAPRLAAWKEAHAPGEPRCTEAPGPALTVEEVAPDVFVHAGEVAEAAPANGGDIANLGFVVGQEAVAAIGSGGSRAVGERLVAAIRAETDLPIRWVVLTHHHPDHVFGATALVDAGAEVIAHDRLATALSMRAESYAASATRLLGAAFAGSASPRVDRTVTDSATLDLGGRVLELVAWPVAHSAADLTVLDRATGTLFAGDLVFDTHTPSLDGALAGWLEVMDRLEVLPAERVVPGHGAAVLPWPDGLAPQRRYLESLARDVRAAIAEGATLDATAEHAAAEEAGHWTLFETFNPRNATVAYTELEWE